VIFRALGLITTIGKLSDVLDRVRLIGRLRARWTVVEVIAEANPLYFNYNIRADTNV
jgi:hypothetical protein